MLAQCIHFLHCMTHHHKLGGLKCHTCMTSQLLWGKEAAYGWLGPLPRPSQGFSQNASWLTLSGEGLTRKTGSRPELTPVTEWLGTPASQWPLAGGPLGSQSPCGCRPFGFLHVWFLMGTFSPLGPGCRVCRTVIPRLGTQPVPLEQSLNHCTTREVPSMAGF